MHDVITRVQSASQSALEVVEGGFVASSAFTINCEITSLTQWISALSAICGAPYTVSSEEVGALYTSNFAFKIRCITRTLT